MKLDKKTIEDLQGIIKKDVDKNYLNTLKTLKAKNVNWNDFTHFELTNTQYIILKKYDSCVGNTLLNVLGKITINEYLKLDNENNY